MFTKAEAESHIAAALEYDAKRAMPAPYPVQTGCYKSLYTTAYREYVMLAKASLSLIAAIRAAEERGQIKPNFDLEMLLTSVHFDTAKWFINKLENPKPIEP